MTGSAPGRAALFDDGLTTTERHAGTFRRDWPEIVDRDVIPSLPPAPAKTARRVEVTDLGETARSRRVQAVKAANENGWQHRIDVAERPDGSGARSVVLRFRRSAGLPWSTFRLVAYWSSTGPEKPLTWVTGFAWHDLGGGQGVRKFHRFASNDLVPMLRSRTIPEPTEFPWTLDVELDLDGEQESAA